MTALWIADTLRAAGLQVIEYPGWKTRAAPGSFAPKALIVHHDASAEGASPSMLDLIAVKGNTSTPPPLSQLWLDTAGVWHPIAAGRCNHAGLGSGWGVLPKDSGNTYAIGIETDHTVGEEWPAKMLSSLRIGAAALLRQMGADPANAYCGHKEYALGRKIDPDGLDLNAERAAVKAVMSGKGKDVRGFILGTGPNGGPVWLGDGITRRWVADPKELDGVRYWLRYKGEDDKVYTFADLRVLGQDIAGQLGQLSAAEAAQLAAIKAISAGPDVDEPALAVALAPILAPLLHAGATEEQVKSAVISVLESVKIDATP